MSVTVITVTFPLLYYSMSPLILYPTALAGYFLSIWLVGLGYYLTHALFPCHTGPREHSANSQPAYFWCSQWMRVLLSSGPLTMAPRTLPAWTALFSYGHSLFHHPSMTLTAFGSSLSYIVTEF